MHVDKSFDVQCSDCQTEGSLFVSCFVEQISSSPAGGKWSGQFGSAGMLANFLLSLDKSWTEGWAKGFLVCSPDCPVQFAFVQFSCRCKSDSDGILLLAQNASTKNYFR